MPRRLFFIIIGLVPMMVAVSCGAQQKSSSQKPIATNESRPNLLFIYLDDFGWKDAGFMGSDFYETPYLDRLAAGGMIFTSAYAGAANCAPSRACLLSGQYSPRHKIFNVGTRPRGKSEFRRLEHIAGVDTLDPTITTWAKSLRDHGYKTATFGKWHLSDDPTKYGFEINVGGTHSGGPPKGYYPPHPDVPGLANAPEGEYLTDRLSQEVDKFIRKNADQPWLVYLTHFAVHTPIQAKKELLGKYKAKQPGQFHTNAKMATMIQSVDDGVGMILSTLKELKIEKRTIIIFCSDNGGYGPATDMAPLKGYKGNFYEGGIRIPFFVNWPGVTEAGSKSDEPITAVDLFPTICEMSGAPIPPSQELDGKSILPILQSKQTTLGENEQPRAIFWHFPCYLQSYRNVIDEQRDPLFRTRPCSVVRKGDWKLVQYFEDNQIELFNLKNDIGETNNLRDRNPEKAKELLDSLMAWQSKTAAPIPVKSNPEFDEQAEAAAINEALKKSSTSN